LSRRKFAFEVSKSKIEDFSPVSGKSRTFVKKGLIALGTHKIGLEDGAGTTWKKGGPLPLTVHSLLVGFVDRLRSF